MCNSPSTRLSSSALRPAQTALAVATLALAVAGTAKALPLPQVALTYNTGVDNAQMLLADGAADPHFLLIAGPAGLLSTPVVPVVRAAGFPLFPVGGWAPVAPTSTSAWIAPDANAFGGIGSFTYRTTFDLSGYSLTDPILLAGNWAADNTGLQVLLNATANSANFNGDLAAAIFGSYSAVPNFGFTAASFAASTFYATSGFQPGINTLDFVLQNNESVTGLRVEYMLEATPVPEPAAWALMASGLLGLSGLLRRRR